MSLTEARYRLQSLKTRYVLLRAGEILLLAVATFLFVFSLAGLFTTLSIWQLVPAIGAAVVMALIQTMRYKLIGLTPDVFTTYLNQHYPQLEESADLFLKNDESMNALQQLQMQRTLNHFNELYPQIKLPNALVRSTVICFVSVGVYVLLSSFGPTIRSSQTNSPDPVIRDIGKSEEKTAPFIKELRIQITPPSYTGIRPTTSGTPHLSLPEGSEVTWLATFSSPVEKALLVFSGKDSITLQKQNETTLRVSRQITESGFYQLQWISEGKKISSDFYKIEVVKDQAPKISIDNLNQFTKLALTDNLSVAVKSTLADDYGLTGAIVIATVSKGSGESVKFREEKLSFERPKKIEGKKIQGELTLNLLKLGLEPGDELYFYVEATDNRQPERNRNRTETFFIALQDTTTSGAIEDEGLGVDLMPEYFRSQRQIIIDSEKLLRDRKKMTKQQFNATSNELGYDQKVLRLRYGQFMGEEFEDQIGGPVVMDDTDDNEKPEDLAKKFGHAHDKENEHNLVENKKPGLPGHDHANEKKDGEQENILEAFAHNHDDGEQATFFIQSVREKLRAALTVMWDAELHLRLYDPEKSLPYQYTALKLLKEISNDSRIYVHRTGFDPPPLKEEKRLSGDLDEINTSTGKLNQTEKEQYPAIRKALVKTEQLLTKNNAMTSADQSLFYQAGQELAAVAVQQPGKYLEGLSWLKQLADGNLNTEEQRTTLLRIRKMLWQVLPSQPVSPGKNPVTLHELDRQFLESYEAVNHE